MGSGGFLFEAENGVVECFLLILEMMFRLLKPPGFISTQNFPACNLFSLYKTNDTRKQKKRISCQHVVTSEPSFSISFSLEMSLSLDVYPAFCLCQEGFCQKVSCLTHVRPPFNDPAASGWSNYRRYQSPQSFEMLCMINY